MSVTFLQNPEPSVDYGREDGGDEMGGATCATHLETDAMGRKKSPQQTKAFAAATAEVTGESKAQINRNVARAEAIGDDLLKLTGTSLDKGVELDALAKLPGQYRDGDGNSRKTGFLGVSVKRMYAGQHGQDPGHSSRTAFPDKLVYGQFDGQTPKSRTAPRAAAGAKNKKASVVLAVAVVRFED